MAKEKKVNSRYTTPADTEKVETFFDKPNHTGNGNNPVYSVLDALLMDWDRVK